MRHCNNPECNKALPLDSHHARRYCSTTCKRRAEYLRDSETIKASASKRYNDNRSEINRARSEEWHSNPRMRAEKAEYDRLRRAARKAAGIKRERTPETRAKNNKRQRDRRRDPVEGPRMRAVERAQYHSNIYRQLKVKMSGGVYKCLSRFGEGKEQIGAFSVDGDDSWFDYTKEVAVATLFSNTHKSEWLAAHGCTHALLVERDQRGVPIDYFTGVYELHHITPQHTFKGQIEDPSTRREAIRELWALDNLVLLHRDEHKAFHRKDNQPSGEGTESSKGDDE